jgi:hypothetical protein
MEFLCRACLAFLFGATAHQFRWEGLRFFTSETILRLSALLGMTTARASFDTIEIQGQLLQFLVSCTFVELFLASLPLIWRLDRSPLINLSRMVPVACALFGFNIFRLELGQIAYSYGVLWILAHDIPLGFAYFAVWATVWQTRSWRAWQDRTPEGERECSLGTGGRHPGEVSPAQGANAG